MTRPLTCLTLIAAAGAGLYLYQEKHRAQMLDREINRVVHATEQTRERTGMMRAEWALLNEPDRLAGLAAQHLSLQPVTPSQFVQLADLSTRLPAVGAPTQPPAAIEPPPPSPIASAAPVPLAPPSRSWTTKPELPGRPDPKGAPSFMAQTAPGMAQTAPGTPTQTTPSTVLQAAPPLMVQTAPSTVLPPRPTTQLLVRATVPSRPHPMRMAAAKPEAEPVSHPMYAPVVPAFASPTPQQPIHQPSVQQASAGLPPTPYGGPAGSTGYGAVPFVGSALGMARTMLSAPVPVANAAELGTSAGR
jgi:hypothetical protein